MRRATTVADLVDALDEAAPFRDAADWDNVGLLAGRRDWPVRRALLAVDLTDAVADEATRSAADALVVYHPPIFKGLRCVTPEAGGPTTRLADLLAARIAVVALHTALDHAPGGTNDMLLDAFDTTRRVPLTPIVREGSAFKLVVFVPPAEVDRLRAALAAEGAGVIGHYTHCSFELSGQGTFRGDETTRPAVGRKLVLERASEVRLEMVVPRARLAPVVRALYANHSYEEPAFDLYPVAELAGRAQAGAARVGVLRRPTRGTDLLKRLAGRVDLKLARVVGDLGRRFASVTAAAGSFGVAQLLDRDSLVLTGEFRHHEALELLRRGVTAVCLDHWTSERPVLDALRRRLGKRLPGVRLGVSRRDASPFRVLR